MLVDTAIVGHLGTTQLASLAIAATVLSTAFTIFNFLTYGTTAQVARLHGAGRDETAARARVAGAVARRSAIGVVLLRADRALRAGDRHAHGRRGRGQGRRGRSTCASAAIGAPLFMLASAAQGFLRGMGDLRTPLLILVAAHTVNVVARAAVRLRLRLGPEGLGVGHGDRAGSGWRRAFFAVQ